MYGVLIMLVVECLEDVGWSHKADNRSCKRLQKWKFDKSSVRGCKN